jgi:TorA maturation chaperone TorD
MKEINETIQRGDCFKLLAASFYEPEKKLFVEEQIGEKLGHLLEKQAPGSAAAAREMQKVLEELEQEKMSIDHAALFVGPFELVAAPYGSVYLEKNRRVMGESSINAARHYQEADLSVDIKEPPDHIVIELEFMYYLCRQEAQAATDGLIDDTRKFRDMQTRFFSEALNPWVVNFCGTIKAGTDNTFYTNLADCLRLFMISCENVYADTH